MLSRILFACCLIGIAFAETKLPLGQQSALAIEELSNKFETLDEEERIDSINEIADVWMGEIRILMSEMGVDPLKLPDVHKNFSFKPILITYHGELDLKRGWAQDVSEVYRDGNVSFDYTDRNLTVSVPIVFRQFLFNYDYSAKLMNLGPTGGVDGRVKDVKITFSLIIDLKKMQVALKSFHVKEIGRIKVTFTGHGLIDWFANILTGLLLKIFKSLVTWIAEGVVRDMLVGLIDLINLVFGQLAPNQFDRAQGVVGDSMKLIM